ncbi:hypothetical protein HHI36_001792, partial [Cryptolaemus montrouzieri]
MRKTHFETKIKTSSNKIRRTWQIVNSLTNKSKQYEANKSQYPSIDPTELVNEFNKYFTNVAVALTRMIKSSKMDIGLRGCEKSFYIFTVTEEERERTVNKLKNNSAYGYDEVPLHVIKKAIKAVSKP